MMVPAGQVVDAVLAELVPLLDIGDAVVDGGNSFYKQTVERGERLAEQGIHYVDCGTSGGVWGLAEGYSLMIGGAEEAVARLTPAFETLAPGAEKGWGHVGPRGAGHFVKMVHNGIEYGLMQAYAEGFAILQRKDDFGLDLAQVSEIWRHGSVVRSWLLDLIAGVLDEDQELDGVAPWVADSGEGRWTVFESIELDTPAPVIALSLIQRLRSRDEESYPDRLLAALRNAFGGHKIKREDG
jgi:6-phosphogluconate dehydrogenase